MKGPSLKQAAVCPITQGFLCAVSKAREKLCSAPSEEVSPKSDVV